ncbi:MAG: hypothetical protein M3340_06605 [Actinomycetota bacterium]|nr:hypothetical protein [Actinomycetota bacterium]
MRRLAPLVLAAVLAAGCGGDDDKGPETPKPAETIQQFQARLTTTVAAIRQGRCPTVEVFNSKAGFQLPCTEQAKKLFAGFKVTGAKTYGTGGVVEFQNAETKGRLGVYTVAVGEDGRYQLTGPLSPIVPKSTLDEPPKDLEKMDAAAKAMIDAIRADDCDRFLAAVVVPPGLPKDQACEQELSQAYGPLNEQLTAHKEAEPERLAGNATFMFYGLRTGDEYRTLIVSRTDQAGTVRGFVTFRGPAQKKT